MSSQPSSLLSTGGISRINPNAPLVWQGALAFAVGMYMLCDPLGFFNQYFKISLQEMNQADKVLIAGCFQQWGIRLIMIAGLCSIACRCGSKRTRMHINVAGAVSNAFNVLLTLAGFSTYTRLGCGWAGLVFNCFFLVFTVGLFALGASMSFELAPIKKPIYWASCGIAVVGLAYSLGCLFIPETLMSSYHVPFHDDKVREIMMSLFHYGWSAVCFQISIWLLAGIMATDFMYIYALNRLIALTGFGKHVVVIFTNVAWWNSMEEDWTHDIIIGQLWNGFMALTFLWFLIYGTVIMEETQVAPSVRAAVSGKSFAHGALGPLTLLSPRSQEKQRVGTYSAPLASEAVAIGEHSLRPIVYRCFGSDMDFRAFAQSASLCAYHHMGV